MIVFLKTVLFPALFVVASDRVNVCALDFEVVNAGFTVTGTMNAKVIEGSFDPAALNESNVLIVADPSSVNTGIKIRDNHLQKPEYFDTSKYPLIQLQSLRFRKLSRNRFSGSFNLTIKGITTQIQIPFTLNHENGKTYYSGYFYINRKIFGIGGDIFTLAEDVTVRFRVS